MDDMPQCWLVAALGKTADYSAKDFSAGEFATDLAANPVELRKQVETILGKCSLRIRILLGTDLIDTCGLGFTPTLFFVMLFGRCGWENNCVFMNPTPRVVFGVEEPKHVISGRWSRIVR